MPMELLSPAGDWDALEAAVQSGADAVYLGTKGFNARRGAENFAGERLRQAVAYCRLRGVRVHVTLNTLVRQDELPALEEVILAIDDARADAVIVQDLGVAAAVRRLAPGLELHASTQMAVHNRQGVDYLADHGFARAVLAREMTYDEIAACKGRGVALEAFVHGALCVSCSGQCLFSSLVGGRSGNRGMCAQPCRLPYRLGDREGYLLSPRDLMLLGELDKLRAAGADSLKIEGRMKRAEYVAVTTAAYRRALDQVERRGSYAPSEEEVQALRQMFNRGGFTQGYIGGLRDQKLMFPDRPNHLGVEVGACPRPGQLRLDRDLEAQDALVLRRPGQEDRPVRLSGSAGALIPCREACPGDSLVRLVSEAQLREARASVRAGNRAFPAGAELFVRVGSPVRLRVTCQGQAVEAVSAEPAAPAQSVPFDAARAEAQLRKTGGTPYRLEQVRVDAEPGAFFPVSALNALRREALEKLDAARLAAREDAWPRGEAALEAPSFPGPESERPLVIAQSGSPAALLRAAAAGAERLVFAPEDLREKALGEALSALKGYSFFLALPPVVGAEVLDRLNAWAWAYSDRIQGVYLTNLGQFSLSWPGRTISGAFMNAANTLTLRELQSAGASAFTPSLELTCAEIEALGGPRELIVYGRIPLMQLRHCPLRAGDPQAKGLHADCRRCDAAPPEKRLGALPLVDRKGAAFPLRRIASDAGCLVQVLNSVPLMLLRRRARLPRALGWRLLLEEGEPVEALVRAHLALAESSRLTPQEACRPEDWAEIERMETTTGHYFRGVE